MEAGRAHVKREAEQDIKRELRERGKKKIDISTYVGPTAHFLVADGSTVESVVVEMGGQQPYQVGTCPDSCFYVFAGVKLYPWEWNS